MANNPKAVENLKPFKKGDPRINRKGRPKSFDTLRKLAQQIAHEPVTKDGQPLVIDGHKVTVIEAIFRKWATSPQHQELFVQYAYGKVPNVVNVTWEDEIVEALQAGQLSPQDVRAAYPDQWSDFFSKAGVKVDDATE